MKIGFCLKDFSASQLSYYAIRNGNKFTRENNTQVIGFYDNPAIPCIKPAFPTMHMVEMFGYAGTVIATDLGTCAKLINSFSPVKRIFYVWDLEWIRMPYKNYEMLYKLYNHPRIELVARSEDHAKAIENCWDRKVERISENFDYNRLIV